MENKHNLLEKISTEEDLISWVEAQRRLSYRQNRLVLGQWIENLSAFHNVPLDDYSFVTDIKNGRLSKNAINELGKYACNWVLPHVRTVASKYISATPKIYVIPSSSDENDIQSAKYGSMLLDAEWEQQKMQMRMVDMGIWIGCIGNAFGIPYMNPNKGEMIFKGIREGQIETKIVNPFKVIVERQFFNAENARWFMWTERLPLDYVEEIYQEEYEGRTGRPLDLTSEVGEKNGFNGEIEYAYLETIGASSITGNFNADESDDSIDVTILFHMPTKRYPHGMYAAIAGNKVLMIRKYPYPFLDTIPLLHFKEIPCPWRLYGESSATQVLKAQETYQKLRKIERDYHLANINRKILAHKNLKIRNTDLQANDNRVIRYTGGKNANPPIPLTSPSVPSSMYESMNLAKEERDWNGGANQGTHGMMPSNNASGKAIIALNQQDSERFTLTSNHNEMEMAKWGKITLKMAKNFYNEKRRYRNSGKLSGGSVFFFSNSDLATANDVVCKPGSMLPKNKMAAKEEAIRDFQAGLFGIPSDPSTITSFRKHVEFFNNEESDIEDAHRAVAEKENEAILSIVEQGISQQAIQTPEDAKNFTMPIQEFDNDAIHVNIHMKRINSMGVVDNPIKYSAIGAHLRQHVMRIQQKTQAQQAQQSNNIPKNKQ